MKKLIIALDGYAGCGKSTTAKAVASKLEYIFIDTGAMYRAVTLYFIKHHINFEDDDQIQEALTHITLEFRLNEDSHKNEIWLNGKNVEKQIRTMQISSKVSEASAIPAVRHFLVAQQQKMGEYGGVVMDGRDIGTVVFPQADLKVFMTAQVKTRAKRRQAELLEKGQDIDLDVIIENLSDRDYIDSTRKEGPLKKAEDAVEIDTTHITIEQQVEQVMELVREKLEG